MKIAIAFPLMLVSAFVCVSAAAGPDSIQDKAKRVSNDKIQSQSIIEELQDTYGRPAWYETASDGDLDRAPREAKSLLLRLSALSVDVGEGPIANVQSVVEGIRDAVGAERACRSDQSCMADRAAKRSEAEFIATVLFPLCEADNELDSPDAHLNRDEIERTKSAVRTLMASYAKVKHRPFKGWRSDCQ